MNQENIAIIGCGNLGLSILNGLINSKQISPKQLIATKRRLESLESFANEGVQITSNNIEAVSKASIVIVALKPYNMVSVFEEIKPVLSSNQIVISLAAGLSLEQLHSYNLGVPVLRAMPNIGAHVGSSLTCISYIENDKNAVKATQSIFDLLGKTILIPDQLMDSATVLGSCGIAYVLRFVRGMIQGGIQIGFDAQTATEIVTHTVRAASELLIEGNEHPEAVIDKVTTPKGCTIVGLNEMEHHGFSSALIRGIVTSFQKIEQ